MTENWMDGIDDIEDLVLSQDITPKERYSSKKSVTVRSRKNQNIEYDCNFREKHVLESVIPGIYFRNIFCALPIVLMHFLNFSTNESQQHSDYCAISNVF